MEWLEVAKKLPRGGKLRMVHGCDKDKSMIVSHGNEGYSAYCFRCGNVGFEPFGYRTLAELEEIKRIDANARRIANSNTLTLPEKSGKIPAEGILWLAKAGLSQQRAASNDIYWSDKIKRVVIPVYSKGKLVYWQARRVLNEPTAKYINPAIDRSEILYKVLPTTCEINTTRLVVTEDIMSAIRVGRHLPTYSLMGTKTSSAQLSSIVKYSRVSIWLDPDKAGEEGAAKLRKAASLFTSVDIINSKADPKCLSDREIRSILKLQPLINPRRVIYD